MRMLKQLILSLVFLVMVVGAGHSGTLFLRDGSELEYESLRRHGNSFAVKVNRDIHLEFPANEVDQGKSFPKKAIKKHPKPARHLTAPRPSRKVPVTRSSVAAVSAQESPAVTSPAAPVAALPAPLPPSAAPKSNHPAKSNAKPAPGVVHPQKAAPPAASSPPAPAQEKEPLNYLLFGSVLALVLLGAALAMLRKRRSSGPAGSEASAMAAQTTFASGLPGGQKKWQIAVLALLVVGGGTFAYLRDTPHYSLYLLKQAMDARDADRAVVYIDFESVIRNMDTNPLGDAFSSLPKMPRAFPGAPQNMPQIKPEEAQRMAKTLTAMMAPMLAEGFKMQFADYVKSPDQGRNPLLSKLRSGKFSDYSIDRNGKTASVSKKGDPSIQIGMARAGYGTWRIVKISVKKKGAQAKL